MKTILLAWELGEGLGHAAPLHEIASRISAIAGDRVRLVFALRDPINTRAIFAESRFPVLPAPCLTDTIPISTHTGSFADFLAAAGFAGLETLHALASAWDDMFAVVRPDLVVADTSPSAMLAARGRMPAVVIGTGFTAPPADLRSFPPLQARAATSYIEPRILEVANAVLARRGAKPLSRLPELFECAFRGVFTVPHLDPYSSLRREPVLGPYGSGLAPAPLPEEPSIFYYGRSNESRIGEVAAALGDCGIPVSAYLRGPATTAVNFLRASGAVVHDRPPPLAEMMRRASIVVSHGGSGVAHAALATGRPQLVLANHLETAITASRVAAVGAGIGLDRYDREAVADALARLAGEERFGLVAQATAHSIRSLGLPADAPAVVARRCLDLIGLEARVPG